MQKRPFFFFFALAAMRALFSRIARFFTATPSTITTTTTTTASTSSVATRTTSASPFVFPGSSNRGFASQSAASAAAAPPPPPPQVLVTTRDVVEGRRIIQELGAVIATSVKSRHLAQDMFARMKGAFFGGELRSYTELMNACVLEATRRAIDEAARMNATALVRVRYQTSTSVDRTSGAFFSVLCYATAVRCSAILDPEVLPPRADEPQIHGPLAEEDFMLDRAAGMGAETDVASASAASSSPPHPQPKP